MSTNGAHKLRSIAIALYFAFPTIAPSNSLPKDDLKFIYGGATEDGLIKVESSPLSNHVDWKKYAPDRFRKADIKNPSNDLLRELLAKQDEYFNAEFSFAVSLPNDVKGALIYSASSSGIEPMQAVKAVGTVRFNLEKRDKEQVKIVDRSYFGNLFMKGLKDKVESGFVFTANKLPVVDRQVPRELLDKVASIMAEDKGYKGATKSHFVMEKAFLFTTGSPSASYLFVKWNSKALLNWMPCHEQMALFKVAPLSKIASGASRCDV